MKKKFIVLMVLGLLAQAEVFAHTSFVTRSWCGGIFHRRFVAEAVSSVLSYTTYNGGYNCIGQYVGYGPYANWTNNCSKTSKGCSRPQVATCVNSGIVYDYIYSGCYLQTGTYGYYNNNVVANHGLGGMSVTNICTGRGSGGLSGTYELDPVLWQNLNDNGESKANFTGNFEIVENNVLSISHLDGYMDITYGADYYSSIKLIVFKENNKITDEEAEINENLVFNGEYQDVVYTSQVSVSNAGFNSDGIFSMDDPNTSVYAYEENGRKGVKIKDMSIALPLEVQLNPEDGLTVMLIVDGGFDISSAVVKYLGKSSAPAIATGMPKNSFDIYPNPSNNRVNFNLDIANDETPVQISCYDVTGRFIQNLYAGTLDKGNVKLENVNISSLPRGVMMIKVSIGDAVTTKRLIVE